MKLDNEYSCPLIAYFRTLIEYFIEIDEYY